MKKNQTILLGALTLTAILMAVFLLATPSREAKGVMTVTGGDFTLVTAGGVGGDEALTVIDNRYQKMLVYRLNNNNLQVIAGLTNAQFARAFSKNAPK